MMLIIVKVTVAMERRRHSVVLRRVVE